MTSRTLRASLPLLLLALLAAAGCDGGGLGHRSCRVTSECSRGATCVDGRCVAGGGDAGPQGDASDPNAIVSLRLEPASADLVVVDGAEVTQAFTAIGRNGLGIETTITNVSWLFDTTLGHMDAAGVLHVTGERGGAASLLAIANVGGVAVRATAPVTIRVQRTYVDPSLDPGIAARFDAATRGTDAPAELVYPLEGAVMPRNVYPPTVQWSPVGGAGDVFRVRVTKPSVTITSFLVAGGGFGHGWLVDRDGWRAIASSDPDDDASITVDRLDATTGEVTPASEARHVHIARGNIYGRVYFWVLNRGRTETLDPVTATATVTVPAPPPNPNDGSRCVACHTVSGDGRWLWGSRGGDGVNVAFDLTTALVGDPSPTRFPPGQALVTMGTFDPTSSYVIGAAGWSGPLRIVDASRGAEAPSTGLPSSGASFPAWSPDGRTIAYSGDVATDGNGHPVSGNLYVTARNGDGLDFAPPTRVHDESALAGAAEGHGTDSHPVWSPDSSRLVFQHGPRTFSFIPGTSQIPEGALYVMTPDGADVRRLDNLDGGPSGTSAYWPSFAPYITDEGGGHRYYWVAFYSRRDYGNTILGARTFRQLWIGAIDASATGGDPSFVPYWLPGQDRDVNNVSAYWASEPCRVTGSSCGSGGECCSGSCDSSAPDHVGMCVPPRAGECRQEGETCGGPGECCAGECVGNVCLPAPG